MTDAIATVTELQGRLDWTLSSEEEGIAQGAIDDLSEDARFYGSMSWDSNTAPRQVKSLVLRAVARFVRNPDGFTQSRAGDETVRWAETEGLGTAYFTSREEKMLGAIAGRGMGIVSAPIVAYGPTRKSGPRYINPYTQDLDYSTGYAPVDGSGYAGEPDEFPIYADDDGSI